MESQPDCESSGQMVKQTEEKLPKCCFVITVGSNGHIEISSHKPDNVANTPEDGKYCDNSTLTDKAVNQKFSIDVLKDYANGINDLQANLADDQEVKSLRKNKINVELQKTLVLPRFVKICNKDLANRPSFVVLGDALARNRVKQDMGHPRSEQLVPCHAQQQTSRSHISSHAGSQTDQYCAQKSVEFNNNSTQKAQVRQKLNSLNNKSTQLVPETRNKAGNTSFSQKQHQKLSEQIQQQHQLQLHEQTQNEHNQKLIEMQEELHKQHFFTYVLRFLTNDPEWSNTRQTYDVSWPAIPEFGTGQLVELFLLQLQQLLFAEDTSSLPNAPD
ncbi:hypothetical protein M5D96_010601 [Drosophila gunungcola]|uniref:Uncharacterized protein n=1 Tax=Drosophila gunungcola TaxID=103775 RepID=A0A9Q0BM93_9MUSC|nr:hypothetical protein M5D96_010601 [Drosophila gunungcola]